MFNNFPVRAMDFDRKHPLASGRDICERLAKEPRRFFSNMPRSGGLEAPAVFLLMVLGVAAVKPLLTLGPFAAVGFIVVGAVRAVLVCGTVVLIARFIFETSVDSEEAFRVVAYASAPAMAWVLPLVGPLSTLLVLYLLWWGVRELLQTDGLEAMMLVAIVVIVVSAVSLTLESPGLAMLINPLYSG